MRKTKSTLKQCAALVSTVSGIALIALLFVFSVFRRDIAHIESSAGVGNEENPVSDERITASLLSYKKNDERLRIDISSIRWDYTESFVYNGSEHKVELVNIPEGIEVVYNDNRHTNAGYYLATYELVYDNSSICLTGVAPSALEWQISKASPDLTDFIGLTQTVVADGNKHSLNVSHLGTEGVRPIVGEGESAPGIHKIAIEFEEDENYLAASPLFAELEIKIRESGGSEIESYASLALMEAFGTSLFIFNIALSAMLISATVLLLFAFIDRRAVKGASVPLVSCEQEVLARPTDNEEPSREQNDPPASSDEGAMSVRINEAFGLCTEAFLSVPEAQINISDTDGLREKILIGNRAVYVRYRSTFTSRLVQCGREAQLRYGEIKNLLLSYEGISSRISQKHELFSLGKLSFAKINIKGKTILVYPVIDQSLIDISKYRSSLSEDTPDNKFPICMKVRSERSLMRAMSLCRELAEALGLDMQKRDHVDYTMPYRDSFSLAKAGLMKIILPRDVGDISYSDIRRADVRAHILGSASYKEENGGSSDVRDAETVSVVK